MNEFFTGAPSAGCRRVAGAHYRPAGAADAITGALYGLVYVELGCRDGCAVEFERWLHQADQVGGRMNRELLELRNGFREREVGQVEGEHVDDVRYVTTAQGREVVTLEVLNTVV